MGERKKQTNKKTHENKPKELLSPISREYMETNRAQQYRNKWCTISIRIFIKMIQYIFSFIM